MKKGLFQRLLPHLIAVVVFLVVAILYCRPALDGMVVNQHDVTQWKGAIHQSQVYKEQHGQYPLWTNSMFSGMPAFQIGSPSNNVVPWIVHTILTLQLPVPIQFFFLACICFYFLCVVLRVNPYIGIFGALSFAYATYNPVIISVGHDTKMWSIAYMPALLASILLLYDKRYWIGAGLTALFTSVLVAMNHPQIDYYLFLTLGVMTLFFAVRWIRNGDWAHLGKALGLTVVAGAIGLLVNAVTILSTYEYQKETIRGGYSELSTPEKGDARTGLSKSYAFDYSMLMTEPLVMLFPRMYGGSSDKAEVAQEDSKAIAAASSMPAELQQQLPLTYYWGGIGITSGPPYAGALVGLLAILGLFVLDNKHKWWMLAAILLAVVMSWGKYFEGFNNLLYHFLPFYNKFRAPSMILVIPQLLLPALAVLSLQKLATTERAAIWPALRKGLIGVGAVFALALLLYFSLSFLSDRDYDLLKAVQQSNQPQLSDAVNGFYEGLKADRRGLMMGDILRTLGFMVLGLGALYLLLRKVLNPVLVGAAFAVLTLLDLLPVASKYLNSENFQEASDNEAVFQKTAKDEEILADKSYYRVFNFSGSAFAEAITSYHYNSLGGYHAVKLRLYQDLIEKQLSKQQPNMAVLNMLNTKYFIQKDQNGLTQNYQRNDSALGPVWLVKQLSFVKDAQAEMQALDNFNPKETAFVRESFRSTAGGTNAFTGEGSIQLLKNDNDIMTYRSTAATNQFAVFSEIFYASGWKAFVDGKETPIVRVNYVLRGLPLAAGNHQIEFRFEPQGYFTGRTITTICSILMLLMLAGGLFLEWRQKRGVQPAA